MFYCFSKVVDRGCGIDMKKQIIRMIAHIIDGMLIGAAIICLVIQEYKSAFIFSAIGILAIMADTITMIKDCSG